MYNKNNSTFIKRNSNNKDTHCDIIDLESFKMTKPIVFCFGGNTTTNTKDANGFCKVAESQLKLLFGGGTVGNVQDHVDLIGASYMITDKDNYGESGELSPYEVDVIVDFILMPLCMDKFGEKISLDNICRNLSQVSFFTFCHGAKEVAKIFNNFNKKMIYLGYSNEEINSARQSLHHISYAPLVENNPIPSLRILSARDCLRDIKARKIIRRLLGENFSGIEFNYDEIGNLYGQENFQSTAESVQIYSSNLLNALRFVKDEHYINILQRSEDWNIEDILVNGEYLQSYNADCVSQMMSWAFSKVVENSIKNSESKEYIPFSLKDLIEDFEFIKDSFNNKYIGTNKDFLELEKIRSNPEEMKRRRNKVMTEVFACENLQEVIQVLEKHDAYDIICDFVSGLWFLSKADKVDLMLLAYQRIAERSGHNDFLNDFLNCE